jgi:hypothetical protein
MLFGSSALLAQSRSTAELTITAIVVPSVAITVPAQGRPQVVVANGADPDEMFGKLSATQAGLRATRAPQDAKRAQTPAKTRPDPAISYHIAVQNQADQLSRTEEFHAITDRAGHSAILKTTTIVLN